MAALAAETEFSGSEWRNRILLASIPHIRATTVNGIWRGGVLFERAQESERLTQHRGNRVGTESTEKKSKTYRRDAESAEKRREIRMQRNT
jgi:hypothetical protein